MKLKLSLDIVLLVMFAVMCNTNATGTLAHEVLGLVYVALIAVHLILNRKWLAALFKGKLRGKKAHKARKSRC
jgi:protein-S-isoprenylcysteine O-methyltransferase Ste14